MVEIKESSYFDVFTTCSLIVDWFDNTSEKDYRIHRIVNAIPEECLYHEMIGDKDVKGREFNSHVSVALGLSENEISVVRYFVENIAMIFPPKFTFGKIKAFKNTDKPYDVLYLEVISQYLESVNATLRKKVKNMLTNFSYKPHLCLAYLNKNDKTCNSLIGSSADGLTGDTIKIRSIDFILPNKKKYILEV